MQHLSLCKLYEGELGGGGRGPDEEPGSTKDFDRWMEVGSGNGTSLSVRGTWKGESFTGDPEGYAK